MITPLHNSPSAAPAAEAVTSTQAPRLVTAAHFTRSAHQGADDGQRGIPSSEADGAKMDELCRAHPDRADPASESMFVNSEQAVPHSHSSEPTSSPVETDTAEVETSSPASATISEKPAHGPCERIARKLPNIDPALVAPAGDLGLIVQKVGYSITPPANNPNCAHPNTCKWARSAASCSACANAAMKARAA